MFLVENNVTGDRLSHIMLTVCATRAGVEAENRKILTFELQDREQFVIVFGVLYPSYIKAFT